MAAKKIIEKKPKTAKKAAASKKVSAKSVAKKTGLTGKTFRITLKKSTIGCTQTQRKTVESLGLRYRQHEIVISDNPANRGQIFKVQHLLDVVPEKTK